MMLLESWVQHTKKMGGWVAEEGFKLLYSCSVAFRAGSNGEKRRGEERRGEDEMASPVRFFTNAFTFLKMSFSSSFAEAWQL